LKEQEKTGVRNLPGQSCGSQIFIMPWAWDQASRL
jgi:hypothetical protein